MSYHVTPLSLLLAPRGCLVSASVLAILVPAPTCGADAPPRFFHLQVDGVQRWAVGLLSKVY